MPRLSFFRVFSMLEAADESDPLFEPVAKMQEELPLMLRENLVPYASALYIQALLNDSEDDWDDDALGENDFRR